MGLHQVKGKSLREALRRAQQEVGERAVVVNQRVRPGGVTLAVTDLPPHDRLELEKLRVEARAMLHKAPALPSPGAADVRRSLERSGASRPLVHAICDRVEESIDEGIHPLDVAAEELGALFPVASARRSEGRTRIMAFVGQSGVGKTASMIKMAMGLFAAGRKICLASLEPTADDQLEKLAERLSIPLHAGEALRDLVPALRTEGTYDVVLLDTAGRPAEDAQRLRRLQDGLARMEAPVDLDTYLVLPATGSPGSLVATGEAARPVQVAGVILTKLDETRAVAPVLEHLIREALPVAFLCDGPHPSHNFHRPTPDRFADLLLRGRIIR